MTVYRPSRRQMKIVVDLFNIVSWLWIPQASSSSVHVLWVNSLNFAQGTLDVLTADCLVYLQDGPYVIVSSYA